MIPRRREIRPPHKPHQVARRCLRVLDVVLDGPSHLAQVVRRDAGRHAHRDAGGPIDQQIRHHRRQHLRHLGGAVKVVDKVDRVAVQVVQHRGRQPREPRFRVAHGRRRIAVHRPEIALAVHQRVANRKRLCHPYQGVVQRLVAVRVVFTHRVAHHARRLAVRRSGRGRDFVHRIQQPAMHRLQPVAHIRNSPRDDRAHRIVDIRGLHLLDDVDGLDVLIGHVVVRHAARLPSPELNRRRCSRPW